MSSNSFNQHLDAIIELAKVAGEKILNIYDTEFDVEQKADNSPLTQADLAAHNVIIETLEKLTPNIPALSEESASIPYSERAQWNPYWLIDPLDGTREFIKRNGEFTVNIALIHQRRSVLGVVYAPVLDKTWYACEGFGAYMQEGTNPSQAIHVKAKNSAPLVIAGSRSHGSKRLLSFLEKVGEHELISMGSSIKMCLVAEGKADVYPRLGLTSEWDTAAAQCIVEQAGGQLTTLDLKPLLYNTKDSLLNPEFLAFGDSDNNWGSILEAVNADIEALT